MQKVSLRFLTPDGGVDPLEVVVVFRHEYVQFLP